ncbi:MAG: MFS transporter, partial [Paracoccaceae bacterium]|nr:MFS transporter [Paracoccaceae bacterium]
AVVAMGRWFVAHRGQAVAVAGLGTALGEAVLPSVVVFAIAWIGWRATWGVAGASLILFFLPILFWLLTTDRQPRGSVERDETTGLDGRHWNRGAVLRHWLFWALLPGLLAPPFIGTSAFFHQVHISEVQGWNLAVMALGYPAYAFFAVASTLLCGWLADRFGPVLLLPVFLLPMGVGITLIGLSDNVLSWHLMMALMGVTQGGAAAVSGTLWPHLYGTRHLGAVKALAAAAMVFATALGPGITGLAIDLGALFPEQTIALALWCFVASIGFLVIRTRIGVPGAVETVAGSQVASKR